MARATLQAIGDAVLRTDAAGNVTYLNPVAEQMTGWSLQEARGVPVSTVLQLRDGETHESMPNPLLTAMLYEHPVGLGLNAVLTDRDGKQRFIEDTSAPIHDQDGQLIGAVMVFRDASRTHATIRQMLRLSQHDFLTDLPNRVVLQERLRRGIESALHHGRILAVLSLDLDGFKQINDSLGHAVGDLLLQSVSRQLLGCARSSDTVSRHGGDEFLILLPAISQAREVVAVAQQMLHVIAAPRQLAHRRLAISASVGIAVFPHDGRTCEVLLRHADTALLAAKTGGRGRYCFHAAPFAPFASRASARLSAAAGGPSHA